MQCQQNNINYYFPAYAPAYLDDLLVVVKKPSVYFGNLSVVKKENKKIPIKKTSYELA